MTGRRLGRVAAAIAAAWFLLTTAGDTRERAATYDEPLHLAGGWTYWQRSDYRIHPENGVLTQRWLTLPCFALRPNLPPADHPESRRPSAGCTPFAQLFLFKSDNDPDRLLATGRAMNSVLGLALATAVGLAARWVWPGLSGLLAFALLCLCPNVVAHAGLATSDVAAALGFLLAAWAWARLLERASVGRLLWSVFAWGVLAGVKTSAALLIPIAVVATLPTLVNRRPWRFQLGNSAGWVRSRWGKGVVLLVLLAAHAVGTVPLVWAWYGFRYSAFASYEPGADGFTTPWESVLTGLGATGSAINAAREHRLLPEASLYGLARTLKYARQRPAYLNGRYSPTGWWYYFPLTFLMKTPLPTLALLLLAAWQGARAAAGANTLRTAVRRRRTRRRVWPFAALLVVYGLVACAGSLNIGYRHLLPILASLFTLAGGLEMARPSIRTFAWLLVAWLAIENVAARPHYLSYFNPLAGGRDRGYLRLTDSNVDWGQDLPAFARWLDRIRTAGDHSPVYFLYFGVDDPERFGIDAPGPFASSAEPLGGWHCFGATAFVAPYQRGLEWGTAAESLYQDLRAAQPEPRPANSREAGLLRDLRQHRLAAGLAGRTPDVVIGGSILAFRLSSAEVQQLLEGPPPRRPARGSP